MISQWWKKLFDTDNSTPINPFESIVPTVGHITMLVCTHEPERAGAILAATSNVEFADAIGVPRDQVIGDTVAFLKERYDIRT